MNREQAKKIWPIIKAFAEGKEIECRVEDKWYKLLEICNSTDFLDNDQFAEAIEEEIQRIANKNVFAHYFDIRTNHLNEKDWRRSFGINQLLYGMILACTSDHKLHENFDSVLEELKKLYKEDTANE